MASLTSRTCSLVRPGTNSRPVTWASSNHGASGAGASSGNRSTRTSYRLSSVRRINGAVGQVMGSGLLGSASGGREAGRIGRLNGLQGILAAA